MAVSLADVLAGMFRRWKLTAAIVVLTTAAATAWALLLPPIYRSEAVVVIASDELGMDGLGGIAGQLGGLAALAGMPLGGGKSRAEAIGMLKSRSLIEKLVGSLGLMPKLFPEKWDAAKGAWKSGGTTPTMGDAVLLFQRRILEVREDLKSGLITIRIEWTDRNDAALWANTLVALANEALRQRTISDADAAIEALEKKASEVDSVELRTAISRLMEAQLKAQTMSTVRKEFAFKVIDPAVVSDLDKRVRPVRSLMVILGALIGMLIAALVAIVLESKRSAAVAPAT